MLLIILIVGAVIIAAAGLGMWLHKRFKVFSSALPIVSLSFLFVCVCLPCDVSIRFKRAMGFTGAHTFYDFDALFLHCISHFIDVLY